MSDALAYDDVAYICERMKVIILRRFPKVYCYVVMDNDNNFK